MLTGDKHKATAGLAACQYFARLSRRDIDDEQCAIMEDLVTCILHLCDQEGMDPFAFVREATKNFEETLVEEDY
jgi:hypothetical protein